MTIFKFLIAAAMLAASEHHTSAEAQRMAFEALPEARLRNGEAFFDKFYQNPPIPLLYIKREGNVTIHARVNIKGRISECEVVESSGDTVLDQWACRGSVRFARFNPGLDKEGNPVESKWRHTFALRLGPSD